ncbi:MULTISPECIES: arylsulfatase [unclassified Streptococcus]|uniref:arylsulfatase n=1 Tax=unclassified Streptococcus TaxID=2608887 RepID=UPI001071A31C|nr:MULTISPECIES: arylsulfatase [unclassified Streptococcus]MBF0787003.1 arylsulfatase [Streptococcus sp. 19428wC2_LYSM12]MCQ9212615.1 arylsulfatase [Streptococcus sp. B01]MCQ9213954.1 arylsulfatase [Streptococcus sp. O1]TFV06041.1 arylsulfatase [Streptococcus sp. LYSM12]
MSYEKRPNVMLIVVDQMRADALAYNNIHSLVSTPTLDMMAAQGYNFENAYSPVPSCVPARVALLTGLDQDHSGRVGYEDEVPWNFKNTLPQTFKDMGYQTECIGKMHVYPSRKRLGFDHVLLHDGYLHIDRKYDKPYGSQFEYANDYLTFLKTNLGHQVDLMDNGLNCNSWEARPWQHEEYLHPTNWVVSEGIRFLEKRDPTVPFFLKLSFEKPHAPLDPPEYYFNMYMERLPEELDLHIGNWEMYDEQTYDIYALHGKLKADDHRRMLAAYFGLITHIDHQICRFLTALKEFQHDKDTIIWFVSDHGDQLGEHYLFRKGYPYQGSIHVPSFIYDPGNLIAANQHSIKQLVKLQDIFPSLLDLALGKEKGGLDGKSVKQLLFGKYEGWRTDFHGEHCLGEDSSQYILTDKWKFIWFSVRDEYQLFDMENDPHEMNNLIHERKYAPVIDELRAKLIDYLQDREEGFVQHGKLTAVSMEQIRSTISAKL